MRLSLCVESDKATHCHLVMNKVLAAIPRQVGYNVNDLRECNVNVLAFADDLVGSTKQSNSDGFKQDRRNVKVLLIRVIA